ncbi:MULTISPECIES: hypothetical protein [unclassified Microcoleus]|uniref:hypothetical protein n=1 Tax=unclassified Microcoleus TaxID=2642155 RepID=UPI002FD63C67
MSTNDIGRTVPISRNLRASGDILDDRPNKSAKWMQSNTLLSLCPPRSPTPKICCQT